MVSEGKTRCRCKSDYGVLQLYLGVLLIVLDVHDISIKDAFSESGGHQQLTYAMTAIAFDVPPDSRNIFRGLRKFGRQSAQTMGARIPSGPH